MDAGVAVVIVSYNTRELLARCLDSVADMAGNIPLELIVVDNGSTDGSVAMLAEHYPHVRVVENDDNVGFARANNQGVALASAPYVLLLNSDAFLTPGALQVLLSVLKRRPEAGMVGAQLRNPDGSFQASYTRFPNLWREFLILSGLGRLLVARWYPSHGPEEDIGPHAVDYIEGACMLVRTEVYKVLGGLDEHYFMYAEEVDFCYRLHRVGWQVWYQPAARVIHLGGGSSQGRQTQREASLYCSRIRFFRRHYGSTAAGLLKALILTSTVIKTWTYAVLRRLSHGRRGRIIVSPRQLALVLKDV